MNVRWEFTLRYLLKWHHRKQWPAYLHTQTHTCSLRFSVSFIVHFPHSGQLLPIWRHTNDLTQKPPWWQKCSYAGVKSQRDKRRTTKNETFLKWQKLMGDFCRLILYWSPGGTHCHYCCSCRRISNATREIYLGFSNRKKILKCKHLQHQVQKWR